ncbi:autophagy protein 5 [Vanrija albida]|uniref:Autophagy protein 5 n=1 Tax=Vanrija albida TaxID=181172 RepID=A0ABR3PUY8_9TREE
MSAGSVQSSTNLFRRLAWNSSVPIEVRLADDVAGGAVDKYYIQAPRYTYLPLLLQGVREQLVDVALDDKALADHADDSQWWFEEDAGEGEESNVKFAPQGPCKWHWPIDLIELHSAIARTGRRGAEAEPDAAPSPLKLILHLSAPPADKLAVPPGIESCKTQFVSQVKEADFVRWGNTKRVTGLRRGDLEAGWEGVVGNDFDLHARMASRVVPLPIPLPPSTQQQSTPSGITSRPPSAEPGATSSREPKLESAYAAKSLPIKVYLPDGAPALQFPVPSLGTDGRPTTLLSLLRTHLPLLFPTTSEPYVLAQPLAQGIILPPDAEAAWLAACMAGADGWLRIGIRIVGEA